MSSVICPISPRSLMYTSRNRRSLRAGSFAVQTFVKRWSSTEASASAAEEARSARNYCADLLRYVTQAAAVPTDSFRKYDAPSYTLLAFVPPTSQSAYLAIRAFNIEIARIPDTVSTPQVGALRYQFWKDNITKALQGIPSKHPVPLLLAAAADSLDDRSKGTAKFSKSWFIRVTSTREQYMNNNPYISLSALESYAENTYSTLLYLSLQSLPMASVTADHVASHIGKAAGISAVLRGLPLLAFPSPANHHSNNVGLDNAIANQRTRSQQGVVNVPLDVMAEAGVKEEDVLRQGAEAPGLRDAVFTVATRASDHLITARTMLQNLRKGDDVGHEFEHAQEVEHSYQEAVSSKAVNQQLTDIERAFGLFMPAVSTSLWLDRLQSVDFDIFNPKLRKREWKLPWKAYLANKRKQF